MYYHAGSDHLPVLKNKNMFSGVWAQLPKLCDESTLLVSVDQLRVAACSGLLAQSCH